MATWGPIQLRLKGSRQVEFDGEASPPPGGGSIPDGGSVENVLALQAVSETIEVTVLASDLTDWASDGASDPSGGYAAGAFTGPDFTGKRVIGIAVEVVTPFSTGGIDTNDWAELKFGDTTLGDWTTDQGSGPPFWYVYVDANPGNEPGTPIVSDGLFPLSVDGLLSGLVLADLGTDVPDAGEVRFTFTVTDDPPAVAPVWEDVSAVLDALPLLPASGANKDGSPLVASASGAQWRQDGYAGARRVTIAPDAAGTWRAVVLLPRDVVVTYIIWRCPGTLSGFDSALLTIDSPQNGGLGVEPYVNAYDVKANGAETSTASIHAIHTPHNLVGPFSAVGMTDGGDVEPRPPDFFEYGDGAGIELDFELVVTGSSSGVFTALVFFQVIGAHTDGALVP